MSELEKLKVVVGYEFLKHIRRKRLWVIFGLALLAEAAILILMPVLADGYPGNVLIMATMLTIGPGLASIGAIFFAGDAIAGEYESRTGFILFTNPIKRITLWTGKFLASYIAVILLVIFTYAIIVISLLAIYGEVPFDTAKSFGLSLLFSGAVISVTFFFSSVSKGAMGATVVTLVFVMVISGIIESVLIFTGNPYWFLISAEGDSIALVYGGIEVFTGGFGGGGFGMPDFEVLDIGLAAWGMVIYLVVGFALSVWISGRRQLA